MTGHELARLLLILPDTEVCYIYDGFCVTPIDIAYQANDGHIIVKHDEETVYDFKNKPNGV